MFKAVELYILGDICGEYITNISKSLLLMFSLINFLKCFPINKDPSVNLRWSIFVFLLFLYSCDPLFLCRMPLAKFKENSARRRAEVAPHVKFTWPLFLQCNISSFELHF